MNDLPWRKVAVAPDTQNQVVVMKFGGSSMEDVAAIGRLARIVELRQLVLRVWKTHALCQETGEAWS